MSGNVYQAVPPSELTPIARYILAEEDQQDLLALQDGQAINSLGPWFPSETIDGIEVEWEESLDTPYTPAIPLRAFDTPVPEGSLPGTETKRAKMIPMGIGYKTGELDSILQRAATGADEADLMRRTAFTAIDRGMRGAINTSELLKSKLLVDAQLVVQHNGVNVSVSVGRDAANEPTSGTAWSNLAGADPHDDENAAIDVLTTNYGLQWSELIVLTNRATYNNYRRIEAVASELNTFRQLDGRLSNTEVNVVRQARDLPPIAVLDRQVMDTDGTMTYLIPNNYWMIVPRVPVGKMVWGSPASLAMSGVDIARDDRPGPVALIEESGPVPLVRRTIIDALGLPFIQAPNWTVRLDTQSGL